MKTKFVLLLCGYFHVIIFFISCNSQVESNLTTWDKSFLNVRTLSSLPVIDEELILGRPFMFQYSDSSLLIYDHIGDSLFILLDLKDNKQIYRFGNRGEGDNEFLHPYSLCRTNSDSILGVYDFPKHQLYAMNLNKMKRGEIEFPTIMKDSLASLRFFLTQDSSYLGLGFYDNNILSLTNELIGSKYFFDYPYRDDREKAIPSRLRGMAYQGTLCSNKSLNKFVYAIANAPIFSIYSVAENNIKKTYEWIAGYPEYKTEENGDIRSAPISADNKKVFMKAYATEKFIYLLYSGKSFREADINCTKCTTIYRLSWKGDPLDKFELDYPMTNFCVSDNDYVLYGLADKGELELVQYALK